VLAAFEAGRFTVVTSEPLLEELAEVLARPRLRKYGITPGNAARLLTLLRRRAELVAVSGELHVCDDPDDDVFVETAICGGADVVVTGDKVLLGTVVSGVRLVSARAFLDELNEKSS
jgi:putative PIN family toxin of toxin-antitoxin system